MKRLVNVALSETEPKSNQLWAKIENDKFDFKFFNSNTGLWESLKWEDINIGVDVDTRSESEKILDLMDDEMPGLRDSLVCWYQPKVQLADDDMTVEEFNDYLADTYNVPGAQQLADLSGNGYGMDLYNMSGDEDDGYLTDDGYLQCDGRDDYFGDVLGIKLTDYHILYDISRPNDSTSITNTLIYKGNKVSGVLNYPRIIYIGRRSYRVSFYQSSPLPTVAYSWPNSGLVEVTRDNVFYDTRTYPISVGGAEDSEAYPLHVGRNAWTDACNFLFRYLILFNRTLSDEERDWVKDNIINYNTTD